MILATPVYTNVTQKGQVTLPVGFRQKVGISPKTKVAVTVRGDEIIIRPVKDLRQFFGKVGNSVGKSPVEGFDLNRARDYMENNYADE